MAQVGSREREWSIFLSVSSGLVSARHHTHPLTHSVSSGLVSAWYHTPNNTQCQQWSGISLASHTH